MAETRIAGLHPSEYLAAAEARLNDAQTLLAERRYSLALYTAGVAAECIFRTFWPVGEAFDEKHDLRDLAKRSDFYPDSNHRAYETVSASVQRMYRLWQNRL